MRQRVVITGIGIICGLGDADGFGEALVTGKTAFIRLTDPRFEGLKADHASLISALPSVDSLNLPSESLDRSARLALIALERSLKNAGLSAPLGARATVVLGTCSGSMLTVEAQAVARQDGVSNTNDTAYTAARYYSTANLAARRAGAAGGAASVVTACAAGSGAAAHGADLIRAGWCDIALVGGADAFAPSTLIGFDALKAVCEGVCAPFSENIGLNLGEGAAFLVLESLKHARRRGAHIRGEILGSGLSNDAYHATSPDPGGKGQLAAMERALRDAGVTSEAIEYINAHGTGTRANDPVESRAVAKLLGERTAQVPVSSTKSMIGHCLGAAGALEAAAVILAAERGVMPPTAGFTTPREGCTLSYVSTPGQSFKGGTVLSNSFGFGGNNACLVLDTRPKDFPTDLSDEVRTASVGSVPVITGMGLLHAMGIGAVPQEGSGVSEITRFDVSSGEQAAMVPELDYRSVDRRLDIRNMDRFAKYLTAAARIALAEGGVEVRPASTAEVGMVLGLSYGPCASEEAHVQAAVRNDYRLDRVDAFPYVVQNAAAGHAARALMLKGHNTVFSTGWGAGLAALGGATLGILHGRAPSLLAAAADELTEVAYRDGREANIWGPETIPGEGAAAFLVEDRRVAEARGSEITAEILGFGGAVHTGEMKCITDDSLRAALTDAFDRAGVNGDEIRFAAFSGIAALAGRGESRIAAALCPKAVPVTVADRIGFPEASACLLSLAEALRLASPGDPIVALSLSREGLAHAAVVRRN